MTSFRSGAALLAAAALLLAACDSSTPTERACRAVFAGTVKTTAGAPVTGATVTVRDTSEVGSLPLTTAVSNTAGEFGGVLGRGCAACAASVTPPTGYRLPAGAPARTPFPIRCAQTAELDLVLEQSAPEPD